VAPRPDPQPSAAGRTPERAYRNVAPPYLSTRPASTCSCPPPRLNGGRASLVSRERRRQGEAAAGPRGTLRHLAERTSSGRRAVPRNRLCLGSKGASTVSEGGRYVHSRAAGERKPLNASYWPVDLEGKLTADGVCAPVERMTRRSSHCLI